jgi:hypothetical protein
MTREFKFGAAFLALVLLTSGLSAFGSCLRGHATAMNKCYGQHCPLMMKTQSAGSEFQAKLAGTSCCKVSSGKPIPESVSLAPIHRPLVAPFLALLEPFASPLLVPRTYSLDEAPPFRGSPTRSALCVFLI